MSASDADLIGADGSGESQSPHGRRTSATVTTLHEKRTHTHSVRRSTAVALLKAGVDFATISQWLGHASLNTTMPYARADLDLTRQALAQFFPDTLAPSRGGHLLLDGRYLMRWLRRM